MQSYFLGQSSFLTSVEYPNEDSDGFVKYIHYHSYNHLGECPEHFIGQSVI